MSDTEHEPTEEEMRAEIDAMLREYQSLHHANTESVKVLNGRATPLNPYVMTGKRLEFFIDAMFGPLGETVERLQFEMSWQRRLQHFIATALNETAGQSLIVPKASGGPAGGLHLP